MIGSPVRRALTLAAFPAVAWIIDVNEKASMISGQRALMDLNAKHVMVITGNWTLT
jgi:hypothetical protein